ncbi:MAG: FxsA family protein [Deltaproteobacteria bacterium]|nr:FxsA family protein [Deltaproteobacteria bacterium]
MLRTLFYAGIGLFMVAATLEGWLFLKVGEIIGIGPTMLWLFISFVLGLTAIRIQGVRVLYEIYQQLQREVLPGRELLDGMLILAGGLMLMAPGYLTDAVGIILLIPPFRWLVRSLVIFVLSPFLPKTRPKGYPGVGGQDVVLILPEIPAKKKRKPRRNPVE